MRGEPSFIVQVEQRSNSPVTFLGDQSDKISSNVQVQAHYFMPYLHEMAAATLLHAVLLAGKSGGIICRLSHAPGWRVVSHAHGRVPACCQ